MSTRAETEHSRRRGREIMEVELAKRGLPRDPGQGAPAGLERRIDETARAIAVTKGQLATAAAAEAAALVEKGFKGDREAFEKGRALLRDPVTYAAYQARLAGEPFAVPVEKRAPDHRTAIRKLATAADFAGLGALFREHGAAAYDQYRELSMGGELRWPADALRRAAVHKAAPTA